MAKKEDISMVFHQAIIEQREELAYSILKNHPEVDINKNGSIHWSIVFQRMKMVDFLLKAGADLNICKLHNSTPLLLALQNYSSQNSRFDELRKLLDAGANPNIPDQSGNLPLIMARDAKEVQLFVDYGADINVIDQKGWTPLMKFIDSGKTENMKFLLSCPQLTTINTSDKYGYTALLLAVEKGITEYVKLLILAGADINCPTPSGRSIMDIANPEIQKIIKQERSAIATAPPIFVAPTEIRKEEAFPPPKPAPTPPPPPPSASAVALPGVKSNSTQPLFRLFGSSKPISPAAAAEPMKSETLAGPPVPLPSPPPRASEEVPTASAVMIVEASNTAVSGSSSIDIGNLLERIRRLEAKVENCETKIQQQQREIEELRGSNPTSRRSSKKWW